jgi:hypothetical protein
MTHDSGIDRNDRKVENGQFTIKRLIVVTALASAAFAVLTSGFPAPWLIALPMLMFSIIVLKSGLRCLIGAAIGFALLFLTTAACRACLPAANAMPYWGLFAAGFLGAPIGGGIHAARIERRERFASKPRDSGGGGFSVERIAMLVLAPVGIFPGWFVANDLASFLVAGSLFSDESPLLGSIPLIGAILGGIAGALVGSLIGRPVDLLRYRKRRQN